MVKFDLRIGLASEAVPLLHEGRLDFAFLDSFGTDSLISQHMVTLEKLDLVCHEDILSQHGNYRHDIDYYRSCPISLTPRTRVFAVMVSDQLFPNP